MNLATSTTKFIFPAHYEHCTLEGTMPDGPCKDYNRSTFLPALSLGNLPNTNYADLLAAFLSILTIIGVLLILHAVHEMLESWIYTTRCTMPTPCHSAQEDPLSSNSPLKLPAPTGVLPRLSDAIKTTFRASQGQSWIYLVALSLGSLPNTFYADPLSVLLLMLGITGVLFILYAWKTRTFVHKVLDEPLSSNSPFKFPMPTGTLPCLPDSIKTALRVSQGQLCNHLTLAARYALQGQDKEYRQLSPAHLRNLIATRGHTLKEDETRYSAKELRELLTSLSNRNRAGWLSRTTHTDDDERKMLEHITGLFYWDRAASLDMKVWSLLHEALTTASDRPHFMLLSLLLKRPIWCFDEKGQVTKVNASGSRAKAIRISIDSGHTHAEVFKGTTPPYEHADNMVEMCRDKQPLSPWKVAGRDSDRYTRSSPFSFPSLPSFPFTSLPFYPLFSYPSSPPQYAQQAPPPGVQAYNFNFGQGNTSPQYDTQGQGNGGGQHTPPPYGPPPPNYAPTPTPYGYQGHFQAINTNTGRMEEVPAMMGHTHYNNHGYTVLAADQSHAVRQVHIGKASGDELRYLISVTNSNGLCAPIPLWQAIGLRNPNDHQNHSQAQGITPQDQGAVAQGSRGQLLNEVLHEHSSRTPPSQRTTRPQGTEPPSTRERLLCDVLKHGTLPKFSKQPTCRMLARLSNEARRARRMRYFVNTKDKLSTEDWTTVRYCRITPDWWAKPLPPTSEMSAAIEQHNSTTNPVLANRRNKGARTRESAPGNTTATPSSPRPSGSEPPSNGELLLLDVYKLGNLPIQENRHTARQLQQLSNAARKRMNYKPLVLNTQASLSARDKVLLNYFRTVKNWWRKAVPKQGDKPPMSPPPLVEEIKRVVAAKLKDTNATGQTSTGERPRSIRRKSHNLEGQRTATPDSHVTAEGRAKPIAAQLAAYDKDSTFGARVTATLPLIKKLTGGVNHNLMQASGYQNKCFIDALAVRLSGGFTSNELKDRVRTGLLDTITVLRNVMVDGKSNNFLNFANVPESASSIGTAVDLDLDYKTLANKDSNEPLGYGSYLATALAFYCNIRVWSVTTSGEVGATTSTPGSTLTPDPRPLNLLCDLKHPAYSRTIDLLLHPSVNGQGGHYEPFLPEQDGCVTAPSALNIGAQGKYMCTYLLNMAMAAEIDNAHEKPAFSIDLTGRAADVDISADDDSDTPASAPSGSNSSAGKASSAPPPPPPPTPSADGAGTNAGADSAEKTPLSAAGDSSTTRGSSSLSSISEEKESDSKSPEGEDSDSKNSNPPSPSARSEPPSKPPSPSTYAEMASRPPSSRASKAAAAGAISNTYLRKADGVNDSESEFNPEEERGSAASSNKKKAATAPTPSDTTAKTNPPHTGGPPSTAHPSTSKKSRGGAAATNSGGK